MSGICHRIRVGRAGGPFVILRQLPCNHNEFSTHLTGQPNRFPILANKLVAALVTKAPLKAATDRR